MRSVIIAGVLLIIIVGMVIFGGSYTKETTLFFNEQLDALQNAVEQGRWDEAHRIAQKLNAAWEEHRSYLAMLFSHQELDQIESAFVRLEQYAKGGAEMDVLAELSVAQTLVKHLPVKYRITIENLF